LAKRKIGSRGAEANKAAFLITLNRNSNELVALRHH
jgi:hypothetical protein